MKIYEEEKSLETIILASDKSVASLVLPIRVTENKDELLIESLNKANWRSVAMAKSLAKIAEYPHPDLLYGSAILASTVINKNDDVFLPEEMWVARNTAINIPYNDQHMEREIIGHTIGSRPLTSEGKLIEQEDAPDYFDLEVDFVMYQSIFPSLAQEILTDAPQGKKFVSMECKFPEFDYALQDSYGNVKIVKRTKSTAFLTKHLRILGGDGDYQGNRVYRVLRDLRFSGMGNVDMPANPKSEYTKFDTFEDIQTISEVVTQKTKVFFYTKGNIMEIETVEQAKELLTAANTKIGQLEEKLKEFEGQEVQKLKETIATLTSEKDNLVAVATEKERIAKEQLEALQAEKSTLATELETVKASLKEKADALDKINLDAKANERVSALKEAGIERKVEDVKAWSDETFATLLEFAKANTSTTVDKANDAEAKAKKELEEAKAKESTDVTNTSGDEQTTEESVKKAVAKLVQNVSRKNSKKK